MANARKWLAIVPVKAPARAKSRLADFTGTNRSTLATAFALDVIGALLGCSFVSTIRVVTDDTDFAALARNLGCQVINDQTNSLNEAIVFAARAGHNSETKAVTDPVAVVVSDLPCATSGAFNALFDQCEVALFGSSPQTQAFLRDQSGQGTTFLAASTAQNLMPLFGPKSAQAHIDVGAWGLGNADPGLQLDVDTRADLEKAIELGVGPHTRGATAEK